MAVKNTRIKICGIRREEDCAYVNEARPDYIGFIFWPKSFRYVNLNQAKALREKIDPSIISVGVFVDESLETIMEIVRSGAISVVQLHGHEDEAFMEKLREKLPEGYEIWKAFKVRSEEDIKKALKSGADKILLDNGYGTGQCFDHSLIHHMERAYILAGGLTPENILEIKKQYDPMILDISSGVETDKVKDRDKILRAVKAARANVV